jgi:hypothetical protein
MGRKLRLTLIAVVALALAGVLVYRFAFWQPARPYATFEALYEKPPADARRVLFVGNSHVFVNDLPHMLQRLAAEGGTKAAPLWVEDASKGGYTFEDHWRDAATRRAIVAGDWDVVVLQPQSTEAAARPRAFETYGRRLAELVREQGARPVLYLVWARSGHDPIYGLASWAGRGPMDLQRYKNESFRRLSEATGASVAPVGPAWLGVRLARPEIGLYSSDGNHAAVPGTYLAACVLYATLFDADPSGLGWHPQGVPPDHAGYLQQTAAEAVREWRGEPTTSGIAPDTGAASPDAGDATGDAASPR